MSGGDGFETLARALPSGSVIAPDPAWAVGGRTPEAVALPEGAEQVRATLAAAREGRLGVVPLGNRTDVGPGAPGRPFVALGTGRMQGIEEYEPGDLTVTARAGTPLAELGSRLAGEGQWLPLDPPHLPSRTLGGLVATGARGPLSTYYGATRDHVLGVRVMTSDGRELALGGRVMKNVAGFDLVRLMVGSQGTLCVILSATLRVFPVPQEDRVLRVRAETARALVQAARAVATAASVPASAVLVDGAGGLPQLAIRVQGSSAALDADEERFADAMARPMERVAGAEASAALDHVRDHAAAGDWVVRVTTLPARLGEVLELLGTMRVQTALAADVLTGRTRVAWSGEDPGVFDALRTSAERVGADLVVERAPAAVSVVDNAGAAADRVRALSVGLRERLDPYGLLSPGRFVA